jgi:hypothetical protein
MSLASVGRIAFVLCVALGVATACGGHSVSNADEDGAADDGSSDDGSSDDGSSDDGSSGSGGGAGSISVGGTTPVGGTSYGGTGQGGVAIGGYGGAAPMGGAAGSVSVGGTGPCSDCPEWEYGLAVEGDGPPFSMNYNGYIPDPVPDDPDAPMCGATPLRGAIGGCGYFVLGACAGSLNEPPCLELASGNARYWDRTGAIWRGRVTAITSNPSIPGVAAGTFRVELSTEAGAMLILDVEFSFCNELMLLDICR